jgi:hypothetical protein
MNHIDFWFNGPPNHNILIYNAYPSGNDLLNTQKSKSTQDESFPDKQIRSNESESEANQKNNHDITMNSDDIHFMENVHLSDNARLVKDIHLSEKKNLYTVLKKTDPSIILIYNIYWDNEDKKKLLEETGYPHHFYSKNTDNNLIDSGIVILSNMPIVIYSNTAHPIKSDRISRLIAFSIKNYQFKINMDNTKTKDGYNFYLKYTPSTDKIIHTDKIINNKIILLKAEKPN